MDFGFIESMAFSVLFNVLKIVVKNPAKKEALRSAMLKLRDAISSAYPDPVGATVQAAAAAPPSVSQQVVEAVAHVASDAVEAVASHGGVKDGW